MVPSVRLPIGTFLFCFIFSFTAVQCTQAQTSSRGTSTASAHSIYGTPPPMDPTAMPLVAPIFLQTDQIDSNITVINSII